MACQHVILPNGTGAIVCGPRQRRRRCKCGRWADLLCDWKVPSQRSGTCDAPICSRCTTSPAPEKDLCPAHAREWQARRAARPHADRAPAPQPSFLDQLIGGPGQ